MHTKKNEFSEKHIKKIARQNVLGIQLGAKMAIANVFKMAIAEEENICNYRRICSLSESITMQKRLQVLKYKF